MALPEDKIEWSSSAYAMIADRIEAAIGLHYDAARKDVMESAIRAIIRERGYDSIDSLVAALDRDSNLLAEIASGLTIKETYFFREYEHYDLLRDHILPPLRNDRSHGGPPRLWSAGCATGEEAYSLAATLVEAGITRAGVMGTDVSERTLRSAVQGHYRQWSLRGSHADRMMPYLTASNDGYRVNDLLRGYVHFRKLNLIRDLYPSSAIGIQAMDVIFCRNVLIYFDTPTVRRVAQHLYESLKPGGFLITSTSDPMIHQHAPFQTVSTGHGIVYRRRLLSEPSDAQFSFDTPKTPRRKITATMPAATRDRIHTDDDRLPTRADSSANGKTLAQAVDQFQLGNYQSVVDILIALPQSHASQVLRVRAMANVDPVEAERVCREGIDAFPNSAELYYLHGLLLLNEGRLSVAAESVRRAIKLDRTLAILHFTLGMIHQRLGEHSEARTAYQDAHNLCKSKPPTGLVHLTDNQRFGELAEAATVQIELIDRRLADR